MKKYFLCIMILCIGTSCTVSQKSDISSPLAQSGAIEMQTGVLVSTGNVLVSQNLSSTGGNIGTGTVESSGETVEIQSFLLLGNETKDIIESYYSKDAGKKDVVTKWLSNEKNYRTSGTGDILEFLDYCEHLVQNEDLKKSVTQTLLKGKKIKLSDENQEVLQSFILFLNGKKTLTELKDTLKQMTPPKNINKEDYNSAVLYLSLYNDILDHLDALGSIECRKIYEKIYE